MAGFSRTRNVLHPASCRSVLPSSVANSVAAFSKLSGRGRGSGRDAAGLRDRHRHPAHRESDQSPAAGGADIAATPCGMRRCIRDQGARSRERQADADRFRAPGRAGAAQRQGRKNRSRASAAMETILVCTMQINQFTYIVNWFCNANSAYIQHKRFSASCFPGRWIKCLYRLRSCHNRCSLSCIFNNNPNQRHTSCDYQAARARYSGANVEYRTAAIAVKHIGIDKKTLARCPGWVRPCDNTSACYGVDR